MKNLFLNDDFMLGNATACSLYHEYAVHMPIFDYHTHLSARNIAEDRLFNDLGEAWLEHDHYKWRLMRLAGAEERFCTGKESTKDKFRKWAEIIPLAIGNPLYAWTHLELKRYFNIDKTLNSETADDIFDKASECLRSREFSVRNLLRRMNVKTVCTTDDPADDLSYHQKIRESNCETSVLPTFRADRARIISDVKGYNSYMDKLGAVAGVDIRDFSALIKALEKRHGYFAERGCRSSDCSLQPPCFKQAGLKEAESIFLKVRGGIMPDAAELAAFETAILLELGRMDASAGWVTQFHIGAARNLCSSLYNSYGPDAGCDAIGDYEVGKPFASLLDALDGKKNISKVIAYNLNPRDNELILSILGSFARGPGSGRMQYGPAWWFLDQRHGMEQHLALLSSFGLLGRFIGMTTDSRSFLSYPRHEYFRRILCNFIGETVERGEYDDDLSRLGEITRNICYTNAERYFAVS